LIDYIIIIARSVIKHSIRIKAPISGPLIEQTEQCRAGIPDYLALQGIDNSATNAQIGTLYNPMSTDNDMNVVSEDLSLEIIAGQSKCKSPRAYWDWSRFMESCCLAAPEVAA
jgi:hypothetical protein